MYLGTLPEVIHESTKKKNKNRYAMYKIDKIDDNGKIYSSRRINRISKSRIDQYKDIDLLASERTSMNQRAASVAGMGLGWMAGGFPGALAGTGIGYLTGSVADRILR